MTDTELIARRYTCVDRRERRARLEAVDTMIETMEGAFGDIGEMILDHAERHDVKVRLYDCVMHGFPEDMLANDVELDLWEAFGVLLALRTAYAAHTHEAEAVAALRAKGVECE